MLSWVNYWQKIIKTSEWFGLVIGTLLLPIDRFPYLHNIPFHFGVISLILLVFATVVRLIEAVYHQDWGSLKRFCFAGLLLALPVIAYAQSITYAIDRRYTVGATEFLLAATLRAFCFFVLIYYRPSLWKVVKQTVYAVTAAAVTFALFQFLFDVFGASRAITDLQKCCTSNATYIFPRVHSFALEPLYFAHFLLIPLWLMTFDFLKNRPGRYNRYLIGLFCLTGAVFILTGARSAFLGLLVGAVLFVLALYQTKGLKRYWLRLGKLWASAAILAISLIMLSGGVSHFIHKTPIHGANAGATGSVQLFSSHAVSVVDESAKTRYHRWPKALSFIKEQPLRGVGGYNSRIKLNLAAYKRGVPDIQLQPFNNELIGLLVDLGLIGVIAFAPLVIILLTAIVRLYRSAWDSFAAPMVLVFVGMLVQSNFFHSLLLTRTWFVVGIALFGFWPARKNRVNSNQTYSIRKETV
ncbi:O-antigen ligase family protein [Candidatus Saccharibacteria bacterium]|nr:O-antigen ligase family protein [Candidatus Saccharibacteria bacterium]